MQQNEGIVKQNIVLQAKVEQLQEQVGRKDEAAEELERLQRLAARYEEDVAGLSARVRQLEEELVAEKDKCQVMVRKNTFAEMTGRVAMPPGGVSAENIARLLDRVK